MAEQPPIRLSIQDEDYGPRLAQQDEELFFERPHHALRVATSRELSAPMRRAITIVRQAIGSLQEQDGHVICGCSLSVQVYVEWLLTAYWLDDFSPDVVDPMANQLVALQNTSGGWPIAVGGADHMGTSLLAYLALKLAGLSADNETMTAARRYLIASGGIHAADARARRYLALYGQIPFSACRLDPVDSFSPVENQAWKVICRLKPVRELAPQFGIGELLLDSVKKGASGNDGRSHRRSLRRAVPTMRQLLGRLLPQANCTEWMGGNAGMLQLRGAFWSAMQEKCQLRLLQGPQKVALDRLTQTVRTEPQRAVRLLSSQQPRQTALAAEAIVGAGMSSQTSALRRAAHAICAATRDVSDHDAAVTLRSLCRLERRELLPAEGVPPELQLMLPEVDSAALSWDTTGRQVQIEGCKKKLRNQLIGSQRRDGSWRRCPDATAHALGALAADGIQLGNNRIDQALRYLRAVQQSDGSWLPEFHFSSADILSGRMLPGAIATTSEVLLGLAAIGLSMTDPAVTMAVHWLRAHQQPGGGWGEYGVKTRGYLAGEGPCRISDTAWAVLALTTSGYDRTQAVQLGVDFLLESEIFAAETESALESNLPVSLENLCLTLRALCEWAKSEDNDQGTMSDVDERSPPVLVRW